MRKFLVLPLAVALLISITSLAAAEVAPGLVSVGSQPAPFSQNKQNEPAVAIDANHPNILAAGANDNIDMEACNAGDDKTCPFTPGVGVSGVYFSIDSGKTWKQPTYTGLTGRGCTGAPGSADEDCTPTVGAIGTVPGYYERGLASDGDPAVAFGPIRGTDGTFRWSNGSRLYYANLTSNIGATRSEAIFKGFEAIAVSRTDDVGRAMADDQAAWMPPVIISKQSSTTFSDKEQIWADNASSSAFFGTVYVCWAAVRGQEKGTSVPAPLQVAVSRDGGTTWSQQQVGSAANNRNKNPTDGCAIRTDSQGNAYLFGIGAKQGAAFEAMSVSKDGGKSWSKPQPVVGPVTQPGRTDPNTGRPAIDGIAGARSDLAPGPSVDIANGAPSGGDATNRIVMTYVSGTLEAPRVYFAESTNSGLSWSAPRPIESPPDRGYYAAPAISPNGKTVYVVYNAFVGPYQATTAASRSLVGVLLQATVSANGAGTTGAFSLVHRGASGDPRGSSQNDLTAEFLGDYVYAAATNTYGVAVWNDTRNAADCEKIDAWRMSLATGGSVQRPSPQQDCPPDFGNSDIFSYTTAP